MENQIIKDKKNIFDKIGIAALLLSLMFATVTVPIYLISMYSSSEKKDKDLFWGLLLLTLFGMWAVQPILQWAFAKDAGLLPFMIGIVISIGVIYFFAAFFKGYFKWCEHIITPYIRKSIDFLKKD